MSLRLFRRAVPALLSGLILASCQPTPPRIGHPQISYAHLAPISLDVGQIEVATEYQAPLGPPHVDHLAPTPPAEAARRWALDRLRAVGTTGTLRVVIKDASIVEVPLPRTSGGGVRGAMTRDQSERYDGRLVVELVIDQPSRRYHGFTGATVARSMSVPEDVSVAGREDVWFTITQQMLANLNTQLEQGIQNNLAAITLK
jgi:hypothetical protein